MSIKRRIENLRDEVRSLVNEEGKQIDPLRLAAALDSVLVDSRDDRDFLWRKYQYRMELWRETRLEMTKAVISFGQNAIRTLILSNGAAAIAVMTFLGNFGGSGAITAAELVMALLHFSIGVAAASFVAGFAYVTQFFYDSSTGRVSRWGVFFHIVAVALAAISAGLFVSGLINAYWSFQSGP